MATILDNFLDKAKSYDKDIRFMAMNDLMAAMKSRSVNWDERATRQALKQLLQLINDSNTEVQNLAMQCTADVIAVANARALKDAVTQLVTQASSSNDKERDVATTALKNVMAQVGAFTPEAPALCQTIVTPLLGNICEKQDGNLILDNLVLLAELCFRFPKHLEHQQQLIVELMLPLLSHPRALVQKRAIATVCALGASLSGDVYKQTMNSIIETLEASQEGPRAQTHVNFVTSLGREVGTRISPYLERLVPLLLRCTEAEEDDDLRDAALRSLDVCARQAPKAFAPFLQQACEACLRFLSYDPNYDYGSDDEDEAAGQSGADAGSDMESDEDEDQDQDDDFDFSDDDEDLSDDDDVSWKVRRAAAKFVHTIFVTRPDLLVYFLRTVAPVLIKQFREREENALADMLLAYATLLHQVEVVEGPSGSAMATDDNSVHALVMQQLGSVIRRSQKHLTHKRMQCREATLAVYRHATTLLPGALADHLAALFPGIKACLIDKASTAGVRQDVLRFLQCVVETHDEGHLRPHLNFMADLLVLGVSDSFYKTVSRALAVCTTFVRMLRPDSAQKPTTEDVAAVHIILKAVRVPFLSGDADLEVREKSIACVGEILARFGDCLEETASDLLQTLMARLTHEMTRVAAAAAFETMCASPVGVDLADSARVALGMLTGYLRLTNKALRNNSLKTLTALISRHPQAAGEEEVRRVLDEVEPLLDQDDQQGAVLIFRLITSCVRAQPAALHVVHTKLLQPMATVVGAKTMTETHLPDACACLQAVVAQGVPHAEVEALLRAQCLDAQQTKTGIRFLAKASARAASSDPALQAQLCVSSFDQLATAVEAERLYHLYTLAALGPDMDVAQVKPEAFDAIQTMLSTETDDFKLGAAHALGSIAAGSPQHVTTLIESIRHEQQQQQQQQQQQEQEQQQSLQAKDTEALELTNLYMLALRQTARDLVGTEEGRQRLQSLAGAVWDVLTGLMDHGSESVRTLLAETMSILCLLDVAGYMRKLSEALQHENARVRGCAVNVARFLLSKDGGEHRTVLRSILPPFLLAIGDNHNDVRRSALGAFKAALITHISLVIDILEQAMELIYMETRVRPDLIHDIQMGPFKHKVDRGADTRKAAYECLYMLLETCPDRLVFSTFLEHILQGLSDDHDIQVLCNLILMKACKKVPTLLLSRLDDISHALEQVLTATAGSKAVKQEVDKLEEVKRVCITCVHSLSSLPGNDKSPGFSSLLGTIHENTELRRRWEDVRRDATLGSMDLGADV